jgi:hypothetical protein
VMAFLVNFSRVGSAVVVDSLISIVRKKGEGNHGRKHQIPTSKHQRSSNNEAPKRQRRSWRCLRSRSSFDVW